MSLISLGTVAIDNLTTPSGVRNNLLGGSAAHFSMSARLFTKVHLASIVGQDFPTKHMNFLKNLGIDTTSVIERDGNTFRWVGEFKKDDMDNAITHETDLGVLMSYSPQVAYDQRNIENVFLANFDPDIQIEFLSLMKNTKFIGLDSMNLWIDIKRKSLQKLMKKVNLFVVNDNEAKMLSEEDNIIKAAKKLRKMGPEIVIIKKGEHGSFVYTDDFMFSFPAYPVDKVIDPTGAGDTFAGGVMGTLTKAKKVNEKTLRQAVINGTTLASFNVQGFAMAKTAPLTLTDMNTRRKDLLKFITP
ncbi:MAG: sugar/nucleoside kinase (ribokinase family) [Lysobacterales bacterium]|jgi:sugar/nucleoside kinase (ribokinase family)